MGKLDWADLKEQEWQQKQKEARGRALLTMASESHIKRTRHSVTVDETNMTINCDICKKEARVITIKGLSPYLFEYVHETEW